MAKNPGPTLIQQSRRVAPAEKAAFHEVTGAGTSHVKREFFGLSQADEAAITELYSIGLDRLLNESQ